MKVSLNTVKEYVDIDISVDELVAKINGQLGGVEEVIDLGIRYKDAVVVRVAECEKHPDADRLSVCKVDDGGNNKDVPRDENGYVQVVCGANNVHAGMFAVWLPPKSTVPSSFDDKELFVLDARELRGVLSQGMLASVKELAIGDDHDGILEIDPDESKPSEVEIAAGASFAAAYQLDDTIIDIENKMFTHRPDLFGQLGVAREIRAILQPEPSADEHSEQFVDDVEWYWRNCEFENADSLKLKTKNEIPKLVPRFMTVAMDNIEVKPSPLWLQTTLVRWGAKPINNVVDLTNYIMLFTAQPTHAYDYDKLRGQMLSVRAAQPNEKLELLNGKTYVLTADDIVIADGEGAIGLAGVMGGRNSEVSNNTTKIVLEVATFDMYAVRKASMRHGLFTDAVTRFNKGQSYLQNHRVLKQLMHLMSQYASASQASSVADLPENDSVKHTEFIHKPLRLDVQFINDRLGLELNAIQAGNILRPAGFASYRPDGGNENELLIHAPFWRTDIELPEDIVEEVGRLYGFDQLPRELPKRSIKPVMQSNKIHTKQMLRDWFSTAGANEVLTYSFVHENTLKRAEQDSSQAFKLSNALSPDLQYYRLSVLPSLLDKVHANIKAGANEFVLFEIGKGHNKKFHLDDDAGLPAELEFVDGVYASKAAKSGAAYYQVKQLINTLAGKLKTDFVYKPITETMDYPVTAPFDQSRSALVETSEGVFIGMIGELKQSVMRKFKLPAYSAAFTLDLEGLCKTMENDTSAYLPLSKFPSTSQDISLKVSNDVAYAALLAVVDETTQSYDSEISVTIEPLAIYQQDKTSDSKTVTFRVKCVSISRTLADSDVSALLEDIAKAAHATCGAERI